MISQPMKGKTVDEIMAEREPLVKKLKEKGYEVIETIFTEIPPRDMDEGIFYLSKSIEAMGKVDGVVFMQGWENNRGCVAEEYIARKYNKFCKYL